MASIPYGYRIENGRPVIIPEEAAKIRIFLLSYLAGNAIEAAGQAADIPLCRQALTRILRDSLYAGKQNYPAILPESQQKKAADAWEKRTHPGNKRCRQPVRVRHQFRLRQPKKELLAEPPERLAERLYALITPSRNGAAVLSRTEEAAILSRLYAPDSPAPGKRKERA